MAEITNLESNLEGVKAELAAAAAKEQAALAQCKDIEKSIANMTSEVSCVAHLNLLLRMKSDYVHTARGQAQGCRERADES